MGGRAPDKPHSPNRLSSTRNRLEEHILSLRAGLRANGESSHREAPGRFLQCHYPSIKPFLGAGPCGSGSATASALQSSKPFPTLTPFTVSPGSSSTLPQNQTWSSTANGRWWLGEVDQVRVTQDTSPSGQRRGAAQGVLHTQLFRPASHYRPSAWYCLHPTVLRKRQSQTRKCSCPGVHEVLTVERDRSMPLIATGSER